MNEQVWWYLARSSGLVAWALATAAVLWGILLHSRLLGRKAPGPWLLDLHRHLGGLAVAFTGIHMAALVADSYVDFRLADLLVPMASGWKTGAVAWGVIAFWGLLAVEVSSLLMKRLPKRVWRGIHLTSYLVFVLATLHGVLAGTDTNNRAVQWGALVSVLLVTFALVYRVLETKRSKQAAATTDRRDALAAARAARASRAAAADGEPVGVRVSGTAGGAR